MLRSRIATEKLLLKTYQDLNSKFNTSNPSLMETTNTAAAEHQLKLVSERDSLPECLTFNCQYCTKSNPTTPVEVNAPVKNSNSFKKVNSDNNESKTSVKVNSKNKKKFKKRKLKKDSVEDFVFPKKTARPASPSISEPVAIANSFSDLVGDKNQVIEDEEAKIADIPNPRPLQPIHLKIKENFRSYLQVRVEGFLVRGITQCYNCNNFFHTASECHLKPRCLKCGNEHPTKQCPIKERQENPFCINCQEYGHSACYTKCPHFPKPKKGTPLTVIQKINKNKCKGVTFANVVSGVNSPPPSTPNATVSIQPSEIKNSSKEIHGIIQEENSDLAQVFELVNLISNIHWCAKIKDETVFSI
ncbi:uncharacterized protein TNCV_2353421 [Trichonephila clavipes]|nr:uncharacterized protein TNCV_2353421 [Trichonephila clavipes]